MTFLHQPNLRLQTISGSTGTSDLTPWTVLLRHLPAAEVDQSNATTCSKLLRPIVCALVFASRPGNCKLCRDAWVVSGADLKWDDGGCQAATGQQFFAAACVCFQSRSREIHPLRERRDAVICRITANVYLLVLSCPSTSLMSDDGRPTHHQTPFCYHSDCFHICSDVSTQVFFSCFGISVVRHSKTASVFERETHYGIACCCTVNIK